MLYPAELGAHVGFPTRKTLHDSTRKQKSARPGRGPKRGTLERVPEQSPQPNTPLAGSSAELRRAESLILEIPDYPASGVLFRDITPLIADGPAFRATVEALVAPFRGAFDVVAGLEARGFLLASAAAYATGAGLMPIRKAGKLPRPAARAGYSLEYGVAEIEAHADFPRGSRVLLIDDVLATGGTLVAARELLRTLGYEAAGAAVLFEIEGLGGRDNVGDPELHTVFRS
ncbi:adenine phosphoribosyltransferase [Leucobacter sp. wl10]|nr:adenine phosphoribosyltransferase [Leucobacter sp. wl10]